MEQKIKLPDGRTATIRVRQPEAYTPNPNNSNRGKERGKAALDSSLQQSGLHRGIVVAADGTVVNGNHAYESAVENGIAKAWVEIDVDGDVGVVTRRIDWKDARDPKAVLAALEDNRTSELNYDPDPEGFSQAIQVLQSADVEIPPSIFTDKEIAALLEKFSEEAIAPEEEAPPSPGKPPQVCPNCGHEF